ncbi:prolyl oligopeptidase family serine peptidase [Micromonospora okii]|uniref:prolyl oligopeptidase family serine peptidase n=1 Tax=Micromonospora okii TaxID=1182970 RepID=UPI001E49AADE|nr:prolyl oligopeptidase family serine peptidase [Micromonospora okii]
MPIRAPYGSWPSGWRAADASGGQAVVDWVGFAGHEVWWVAADPGDGRNHLVRRGADGRPEDVLPGGWDVRTAFMEYGGRPWAALGSGGAVFVNWSDQRVYRWTPGGAVRAVSPPSDRHRYCDFAVRGDEVWCVRETIDGGVRRELVALRSDGSAPARVLAATHDFLSGPRIAPDATRVAWLGWDHPHLPWTRTAVMVADIDAHGALVGTRRLATGADESVTQVEWTADGSALLVVSDRSGWWNVHEVGPDGRWRARCPRAEEFGEALWRVGASTCAALAGGGVAVAHGTGLRRLGLLDAGGDLVDVDADFTDWRSVVGDGRRVAAVAAGPRRSRSVVLVEHGRARVLWSSPGDLAAYASVPLLRTYRGVPAHVYEPYHPGYAGLPGELPPYIVQAHGGPTSRGLPVADAVTTYFTSRGIGVVDVQYGGSTGYGRAYRDRLRHRWGEVDARDCATVARGLIAEGRADPGRIAFRGASAGGWTALRSLIDEPDLYRAAVAYYPVLDARSWATSTHDFESRYADWLIGPWPRERDRYEARSPAAAASRIRTPLLLLQGARDAICVPDQADLLAERLADASVPVRYLRFREEGHGFRHAETLARCLDAELDLYATALRLSAAGRGVAPG